MVFGSVSTSQFISLLIVPLSIVMLYWLARRGTDAAPVAAPSARPRTAGA
jgi:hypothetical protein